MKKYILNIWLLGCLGLFLSCSDLDGKYDELVPDEYHKILSIKETGSQEVIMSGIRVSVDSDKRWFT